MASTIHSAISQTMRLIRKHDELEPLLGRETRNIIPTHVQDLDPHAQFPVYENIHKIRHLILAAIDDPYTIEQLQIPRINVTIVKPAIEQLYNPEDISTVYSLLVNRQRFIHDQFRHGNHQVLDLTRAALCELVAVGVLQRFNEDNQGRQGLLLLANILVVGFDPFQNCPDNLLAKYLETGGRSRTSNALEVAILSESRHFLSSTACQRVIESIYYGRVIYTPNSFFDIIPDHYKRNDISLYDPHKAPLLNQYRLIVPRTRKYLELFHFFVLLGLYTATMVTRSPNGETSLWEIAFMIYVVGWILDEFASMLEHGWKVHMQNLWSYLDLIFVGIYAVYVCLRISGWMADDSGLRIQALDVLACAAPVLFSRIAFNAVPESMLFISLRAMISDFVILMSLAAWCFGGFLLAMSWLSGWANTGEEDVPPVVISRWMVQIWFGLDGAGLVDSATLHEILGPMLMLTFAFLGNNLFLTVLVAMLTNTFAKVATDAEVEIKFRRAVLTFEGVKSDAIFAYRPPFNIAAVVLLLPLKLVITPRWFHKIHITAARVLNAPLLLGLSLFERLYLWDDADLQKTKSRGSSRLSLGWLNVHQSLNDVFEMDDENEGGDTDLSDGGVGSVEAVRKKSSVGSIAASDQEEEEA